MKENPLIEDILLSGRELAHVGNMMTDLNYNEQPIDEVKMDIKNVGSNYAGFTQTKILEGRFLKEGATDEMVINLSAKKLLGKEQILGEVIKSYNVYFTIVGVVEDVLSNDTHSEIMATFFRPARETGNVYLKINPQQRKKAISFIKKTLNEYVPESIGYQLLTLNDRIAQISRMENILFKFIGSFAIIAIIISLFGVYSSVLLTTERRRKEVAIRKINGAVLSDIIRLFLNTYLYILLIVAIPAFGVTYWILDKWLETYTYPISLSWIVFVLLFLLLAALLTLTIIYQLIKIARINPAEVIKTE
jgi:ABC-type antimicrobial peptide transport system permease subunit